MVGECEAQSFVPSDIDTPTGTFCPLGAELIAEQQTGVTAVRMSAPSRMKVRIFAADPRGIAAAETEIVDLPLEIRVRIVVVARLIMVVRLTIGAANMASRIHPDVMVS